MADLTPDRLQELRRIAEAATPGPWEIPGANVVQYVATFDPPTVLALLDEIERLRRELKGGDRGWPTRESERARLVAEVGECCRGADPLCAAGCLVEAALRQRPVDKEGTA